jgi:hypothetical protein
VSNIWEPKSTSTVNSALVGGTLRIASDTGLNFFREFWPDIKKKFRRK